MKALAHTAERTGLALALAVSFFALPALAAPAPSRAPVEKARRLVENAEFESALKLIDEALAGPTSDATLVSLRELQGIACLYLGREAKAREAFAKLLEAAPEHELSKRTSSKIRALFEEVRKARNVPKAVRIDHGQPSSANAGERLDLTAGFHDLPKGAQARLFYRRGGAEAFSSTAFVPGDSGLWSAIVPAFALPVEPTQYYSLEYYIEVSDASGQRLGGVAEAQRPLAVPVAPSPAVEVAPEESWYQKWWVWTIAGAVVAGAAVAIAVPLLSDDGARLPVTVRVQQ